MRKLNFYNPNANLTWGTVNDILHLVEHELIPGVAYSTNELLLAYDWGMREHFRASDNPVRARQRPSFVQRRVHRDRTEEPEDVLNLLIEKLTQVPPGGTIVLRREDVQRIVGRLWVPSTDLNENRRVREDKPAGTLTIAATAFDRDYLEAMERLRTHPGEDPIEDAPSSAPPAQGGTETGGPMELSTDPDSSPGRA